MIFRVRRDSIRQFRQTVSTRARQDGSRRMDGLPNGWTQYLVDHPADYSRLEPFPMTCFASVSLCLSPGCPADTSQVERNPLEFSSWIRSLEKAGVAQYSKHRFVCSLVASQEDLLRSFSINIFPHRSPYWKPSASARCPRTPESDGSRSNC